jgi:hypothetical protein
MSEAFRNKGNVRDFEGRLEIAEGTLIGAWEA